MINVRIPSAVSAIVPVTHIHTRIIYIYILQQLRTKTSLGGLRDFFIMAPEDTPHFLWLQIKLMELLLCIRAYIYEKRYSQHIYFWGNCQIHIKVLFCSFVSIWLSKRRSNVSRTCCQWNVMTKQTIGSFGLFCKILDWSDEIVTITIWFS